MLAVLAFQRVDDLLVLAGAERGDHQSLGLAAGEQRRAVGARQHADLGSRSGGRSWCRGRRCAMPVSRMLPRTMSASSSFRTLADQFGVGIALGRRRLDRLGLDRADLGVAGLLDALRIGVAQRRSAVGASSLALAAASSPRAAAGSRQGSLAHCLGQLDDRLDHRLELLDGRT